MTTATRRARVKQYGIALAATAGAVALRGLLDPVMGNTLPLVTVFGAVAIAVWSGGYGPALFATAIGYLACNYLFVMPRGQFVVDAPALVGMFAYVTTCLIIIGFGETARVSRRRFDEIVQRHEQPLRPTFIERVRRTHHLRDLAVAGFALTMAMLVVSCALGLLNVRKLARNAQQLAHTHDVIANVDALLSSLKDA